MDPVNCLLPEILDRVWCLLSVRDLLASRLVSTRWHASVTSSSGAWRCKMRGELGSDWRGFLEGMKVRKRWSRASSSGFSRSVDLGPCKFWAANDKAVYFATDDDRLVMADPSGRVVRTLNRVRLARIHSGWTGLVLEPHDGTVFGTDLVMNVTGDLGVGKVEAVSESLVVLSERSTNEVRIITGDKTDSMVFKEINGVAQCEALRGVVVFSHGFPTRHVTIYNVTTSRMSRLKTFEASPMCIPRLSIVPGQNDHFCLLADINSDRYPFNRVIVYQEDRSCHEDTLDNLHSVGFTRDYFICLTDSLTVIYTLTSWSRHQVIQTSNLRMTELAPFEGIFHEDAFCKNWFVSRAGDRACIYDASLCKTLCEIDLSGVLIKYFYEWIVVDDLISLGVKNI